MDLFDLGRKGKRLKPTPPQMRFLHILSRSRLVFRTWPERLYDLVDSDGNNNSWRFPSLRVADNVVLNGWAAMTEFDGKHAVYRISESGKQALNEFCEHEHMVDEATENLAGKLICKQCARSLRCRSKQPTPHAASRWHWKYGPMCQACWEFLYGEGRRGTG